ncbi:MAG: NAD(P)-dependent oxidoreductase [Reyranella sp.]|uniref:NAD-dependent epimerase/dehydratase family protein n=1 Tax=Reyranella sp. TaxID=1929291 RepID=UPI001AC6C4E1|nr:NAD(P)-dependent oxidoreductase [Reyranella sp.]MBN9087599.1 NAD(P)-dependent oxidoreductase [Reyranella sp.]
MNILVTGSSGWLAQDLIPRLKRAGHTVVGLDVLAGPHTDIVDTVANRDTVRKAIRDHRIQGIVHAGGLHKPQVATHDATRFIETNVQGTLNLLQEATARGSTVDRFVFTSTTSLMISQEIRDAHRRGADRAFWIDEEMTTLEPRNIYGVSKLSAEHLCRMVHEASGLPTVILRTSRFFPEEDDMAHEIIQSSANTKANEFLFRRLTVHDAASAHIVALDRAPQIGFDTFIISALTPFSPDDCEQLMEYAPLVVHRYFPRYREIYARRGWTMFDYIDRVYDSNKAMRRMGFVCQTDFGDILTQLDREDGI